MFRTIGDEDVYFTTCRIFTIYVFLSNPIFRIHSRFAIVNLPAFRQNLFYLLQKQL